jgi:hypothetical protein
METVVSVFLFRHLTPPPKEKGMSPSELEAGFNLAVGLINAGLFGEIDDGRLAEIAPKGSVMVSCGDRDRFRHYFERVRSVVELHPITLNGGAILLGPGIDQRRQDVVIEDISDALALKGMSTVVLSSHFPCGKAGLLGLGLKDIVLKTLEGKRSLKAQFPDIRVLPLISIDWRPSSKERDDRTFIETFTIHLRDMERIRSFV